MCSAAALEVVPLGPAYVPAAAALVTARIGTLRASIPTVPAAWSDEASLARLVGELAVRGSGVVALRAGRPVGFQAATLIDGHGGRWAYTPDVGHASTGEEHARVIEAMYTRLAAAWVRDACLEHTVTVLANDTEAITTWGRMGFGQSMVDLVRDLSPVEGHGPVPGIHVRRAGPADDAVIHALDLNLRAHVTASPIFLRARPAMPREILRAELADPTRATFVAEADGEAVAHLRIGPSATDVATIVRDPSTASITAAFTVTGRRGAGIATSLLDVALQWARDAGYTRSAVDHESANGEASRFWARHFVPVAVTLTRRLPPRVGP
jgi:GNAT superfamily N-acetyltransferase